MRKRTTKRFGFITFVTVALILFLFGKAALVLANNTLFKDKPDLETLTSQLLSETTNHVLPQEKKSSAEQSMLQVAQLNSETALLIRLEDGHVLYEQKKGTKIYPASLTKIMTTLVAIEHLADLNTSISINPVTLDRLFAEGASIAGFERNDDARALDLLYGVMLPSGAEASAALAEHIAGSEEEFVHLMNAKSKALGLKKTHFVNTTGLHARKQYSTAEDISTLLVDALNNQIFREIFTAKHYATSPTQSKPEGMTFESTVFSRLDGREHFKKGQITGGKTGYTPEAGLCLATLADVNGQEYLLVTANAQTKSNLENYHIEDALTLYNAIPL